jgi:alpha-N-arabinofuranosidase
MIMQFDKNWAGHETALVRSEMLGRAKIPDLPYENPDGKPYRLHRDYFGNGRKSSNPYPGPFIEQPEGEHPIKVWPKKGY